MPAIIVRFAIFALCHSLLSADCVKYRVRACWPSTARFYRLAYNLLAIASFGWVVAVLPGSSQLYAVHPTGATVMRFSQVILLMLLCRCTMQTGLEDFLGLRQLRHSKDDHTPQLITKGCYRLVRHPQYALASALLILNPVVTINYALFSLLSTLYFLWGCFIEERRLLALFGAEYRQYRDNTPLIIPRIRS